MDMGTWRAPLVSGTVGRPLAPTPPSPASMAASRSLRKARLKERMCSSPEKMSVISAMEMSGALLFADASSSGKIFCVLAT